MLQDVPEELKARTDTRGEASLRGHLKADGDEQTGSQSYFPVDKPQDDKALKAGIDFLHGIKPRSPPRRPDPDRQGLDPADGQGQAQGRQLTVLRFRRSGAAVWLPLLFWDSSSDDLGDGRT